MMSSEPEQTLVENVPSLETVQTEELSEETFTHGRSISTRFLDQITLAGHLGEGENEAPPAASEDKQLEGWQRYKGILFTIYAILMTSLASNVLKLITHIHPLTISVYSFLIGSVTSAPFVWYRHKIVKKPILDDLLPFHEHKKVLFFMWVRSTCTLLLTMALCWLGKYIAESDTRTIIVSYTILINMVAWIWFQEKFGIVKGAASVITVCGVAIMTKTPFLLGRGTTTDIPIANINAVGFCCMIFVSINMLVLRHLHHIYHGVRNTFLFTWGLAWALPFAIGHNLMVVPNCNSWDIAGIAAYGILLSLNNTFFAWALKKEEAGIVALARSSEFVLSSTWQIILFSNFPDGISVGGMCLALTGLITATLRTWVKGKADGSLAKRYFGWLLL